MNHEELKTFIRLKYGTPRISIEYISQLPCTILRKIYVVITDGIKYDDRFPLPPDQILPDIVHMELTRLNNIRRITRAEAKKIITQAIIDYHNKNE